ncbi:MAG TPA: phosphoadenosine phosphosulfate reductase family protein, partial [Streptomyces sp.]
IRFEAVSRTKGDLLDQIEARRMFPSSAARYCTSDQKTSQVAKLMTRQAAAFRDHGHDRPIRILNCLGLRAEESPARAKKIPIGPDPASNGRRDVTRWLPIFDWTEVDVWQTIGRSGVPYHPAYAAGMPRLSCVFCVLAGRKELVLAARLNPGLAQEYAQLEARIGHAFKADLSMAEIVAAASGSG